MTQQGLADAAGVDLKTIYNLESGTRWPIARTRVAVSAALRWEGDALTAIADHAVPGRAEPVPAVPLPRTPRGVAPSVLQRGEEDIFPGIAPDIQAAVDREFASIAPLVLEAVATHPEAVILGRWVFPDSDDDARNWDSYTALGWSLWQRTQAVAVSRVLRRRRANPESHAAGLTPAYHGSVTMRLPAAENCCPDRVTASSE